MQQLEPNSSTKSLSIHKRKIIKQLMKSAFRIVFATIIFAYFSPIFTMAKDGDFKTSVLFLNVFYTLGEKHPTFSNAHCSLYKKTVKTRYAAGGECTALQVFATDRDGSEWIANAFSADSYNCLTLRELNIASREIINVLNKKKRVCSTVSWVKTPPKRN